MEGNDLERVLGEISKDIRGCLSNGFSKVVVCGSEENYRILREFLSINYQSISLERVEYSRTKPESLDKVYIVDIDSVSKLKNPQDISMHRKYGLEYDIRAGR